DDLSSNQPVPRRRDPDDEQRQMLGSRGNRPQDREPVHGVPKLGRVVVEKSEQVPAWLKTVYVLDGIRYFARDPARAEDDQILIQRGSRVAAAEIPANSSVGARVEQARRWMWRPGSSAISLPA